VDVKRKLLKKELSLLHVVSIATGAMVSSGIFLLPGLAFDKTGPSVVVSYIFAGIFALTGLLSIAELVTAMPKAGGDYYFITRGMGPAVGSIAGLLTWFALSLKSAFALVGMSAFTALFFDIPIEVTGLVLCVFFTLLNIFGAKTTGRFQVFFVIIMTGLMAFFIVRGLPHVQIDYFKPFRFRGTGGVFFAAGFVFVAYGGLLKVSSVAEEVKDPGKNLPLGMLLSLGFAIIAYALMVFITVGTQPAEKLRTSLTPIVDSAGTFAGTSGALLVGFAAILAFLSTANAGIMAASRYLLALGRDGLAPAFLFRINRRFHTPHYAILITGLFISVTLFLELEVLVEAASLVFIIGYILSCLCVIIMRESDVQNYRPVFRTPAYPLPQIIGIIGFSYLVLEMGREAYSIILLLISFSAIAFVLYGRKRNSQEYALLHFIERLTSKSIVTGTLESELKQVLRERDNVYLDQFDRLVAKSAVIDIDDKVDIDELFKRVSKVMAPRVKTDADVLYRLFQEREDYCVSSIIPGIAIPDIVLDNADTFDIALVRVQKGVVFPCSETGKPVQMIFVIFGSADQRTLHLQTLANIAQIAMSKPLFQKWAAAKDKCALRDAVLLAERTRHESM
jgi:basic amino acid/polyamine antiporter, APA family